MSNVITLTTDFGHKGPFVAIMHGVMLSRAPLAKIIDLTHDVHVHWPAEAGFWLSHSYQYFPKGSVHVAVVDPGVGTDRNIVALEFDGHIFLAPDNGLLPDSMMSASRARVFRLDDMWRAAQDWPEPSNTFHGRDIFAPLAAEFITGRIQPADIGNLVTDYVPSLLDAPQLGGHEVQGTVVTLDHFGNLITNIESTCLDGLRAPQVEAGGQRLPLQDTYGQSKPGDFLALINSFGVLEIARAEGSAADALGIGRGAPVAVRGSASS